jgi:diacylglycerol kinase family enzyme
LPPTADDANAVLIFAFGFDFDFGDDGTLHRHLAQAVKLCLPLRGVPRGRGNDFARALRIRGVRDALGEWRSLAAGAGNTNSIDLGVIEAEKAKSAADLGQPRAPRSQYFCWSAGLDAEINGRANLLARRLPRRPGYALCLPPARLRFAPNADQDFDLSKLRCSRIRYPPQARLDDGKLEVCVISAVAKFKLLCPFSDERLRPAFAVPAGRLFSGGGVRLETQPGPEVYADGEYLCRTRSSQPIALFGMERQGACGRGAFRPVRSLP